MCDILWGWLLQDLRKEMRAVLIKVQNLQRQSRFLHRLRLSFLLREFFFGLRYQVSTWFLWQHQGAIMQTL